MTKSHPTKHLVTFQVTYRVEVDTAYSENYVGMLSGSEDPRTIAAEMVTTDFETDEVYFVAEVAGEAISYGVTHVEALDG